MLILENVFIDDYAILNMITVLLMFMQDFILNVESKLRLSSSVNIITNIFHLECF